MVLANFIKKFRLLQDYCHEEAKMLTLTPPVHRLMESGIGCILSHMVYIF
jgi:hypothetical protein